MLKSILINTGIVVVILWVLVPIYFIFISAFKSNAEIFSYPPSLVFNPSLAGFLQALNVAASNQTIENWIGSFANSTIISLAATAIALLLGVPVAYALAHLDLPNKQGTAFGFLTLRMLPPIAVLLPIYLMLLQLHLIDTYPGMIMIFVIYGLPWIVWLMWSFFDSVPHAMVEAGKLDGASDLTILVRLLLPIAASGLIVSGVFSFLQIWNDFLIAFIIGGNHTMTVPVSLGTLLSERMSLWNTLFAVGVLNLIPSVIIMLLIRKHWARALTLGLVK